MNGTNNNDGYNYNNDTSISSMEMDACDSSKVYNDNQDVALLDGYGCEYAVNNYENSSTDAAGSVQTFMCDDSNDYNTNQHGRGALLDGHACEYDFTSCNDDIRSTQSEMTDNDSDQYNMSEMDEMYDNSSDVQSEMSDNGSNQDGMSETPEMYDDTSNDVQTGIYQGGRGMPINIISRNKRSYKALNATGLRLEVKFSPPTSKDIVHWLKHCIDNLLIIIENELAIQPHDRVGINFNNTNNCRADFSLSFRPFNQYSTHSILNELEKVIQSNSLFFLMTI